jgi:hypothetical protein
MKIFEVLWYNEDGYGMMENTIVIVRSETPEQALVLAKEHLGKVIHHSTVDAFLGQYSKTDIIDISDKEVIYCSINVI